MEDQSIKYYRVKSLAVSGKKKMFRNKTQITLESGEIKTVPTIVTTDDFHGDDAEKLCKAGHLEAVTEKEAEDNHQKKSGTGTSSDSGKGGVKDEEKSFEDLKKEFLELGGDESAIKSNWGAPAMLKALTAHKEALLAKFNEMKESYKKATGTDCPEDWDMATLGAELKKMRDAAMGILTTAYKAFFDEDADVDENTDIEEFKEIFKEKSKELYTELGGTEDIPEDISFEDMNEKLQALIDADSSGGGEDNGNKDPEEEEPKT